MVIWGLLVVFVRQHWGRATRRGVTDGRKDECVSAGPRAKQAAQSSLPLHVVTVVQYGHIVLTEAILDLMSAA